MTNHISSSPPSGRYALLLQWAKNDTRHGPSLGIDGDSRFRLFPISYQSSNGFLAALQTELDGNKNLTHRFRPNNPTLSKSFSPFVISQIWDPESKEYSFATFSDSVLRSRYPAKPLVIYHGLIPLLMWLSQRTPDICTLTPTSNPELNLLTTSG